MKRKIYGAPGQMECKLIINNGQFRAEVHFRGGSIMDNTRRPASFATSRFIEQDIIENSTEFKCGKIILLHTMEVPDDAEELARKASLEKEQVAEAADEAPTADESGADGSTTDVPGSGAAPEGADTEKPTDSEAEADVTPTGSEDAGDSEVQTIEVSCKADAVEWLKEHYPEKGYNGNNLRSNAAFEAACNEAGVKFTFAE